MGTEPGVVTMPSRVDVSASAEVRAALHAALDTTEGDLVVDLAAVELVDAAGLGVLVGVRRRAANDDRAVVLRSTPPRVRRLLGATRLARLFVLEDDPAAVPGVPAVS
jgi:anti-sigma B factor antagonist